jgi:hypothetical protein
MLGMIRIFTMTIPNTSKLVEIISLTAPQGWAVRGLVQTIDGEIFTDVLNTTLVLLAWGVVFFALGIRRFNRRYT